MPSFEFPLVIVVVVVVSQRQTGRFFELSSLRERARKACSVVGSFLIEQGRRVADLFVCFIVEAKSARSTSGSLKIKMRDKQNSLELLSY